jgi:TetR/AcrR family transcriptional regulator, transcriptional repressor for nem operon
MSKAEKTRAFIIEKIAPVFNKKGYAGTSLADLTGATGLTKGALYGNFENKDKIALAAFDYNVKKIQGYLSSSNKTAIEKLLSIPLLYKKHFSDIAAHGGCPILNTAVEADDNLPLLRKKVQKAIVSWQEEMIALIKEAMDAGEINKGIDPSKYARIFIALFEGGMMLSKATNDTSYFYESLDKMTDIIENELRK